MQFAAIVLLFCLNLAQAQEPAFPAESRIADFIDSREDYLLRLVLTPDENLHVLRCASDSCLPVSQSVSLGELDAFAQALDTDPYWEERGQARFVAGQAAVMGIVAGGFKGGWQGAGLAGAAVLASAGVYKILTLTFGDDGVVSDFAVYDRYIPLALVILGEKRRARIEVERGALPRMLENWSQVLMLMAEYKAR